MLPLASSVTRGITTVDRGYFLHDELHWLDVPQRVHKLCATVHRCLQHKTPQYMTDCCIHTSSIARRQHLRSAGFYQPFVPRHRRSISVVGPFLWLARWPSTPYQTTCEIRHVPLTVFAGT